MENNKIYEKPCPEELQLTEQDIIKNRCDLLTSQLKLVNEMMDKLTKENEEFKKLFISIYEKIGYTDSEDDSEDDSENVLCNSIVEELEKKQD